MASNTYVPLNSAAEFGRRLIESGDLDPIYGMLASDILDGPTLKRWLLTYWMFYHAGVASAQSELEQPMSYWGTMMKHFEGDSKYPRGAERRHFRGPSAHAAVGWFSVHPPEYWVDSLLEARSFKDVQAIVKPWPQFGPWITFKIADMLERLGLAPISFDIDLAIYEEPLKGAALVITGDQDAKITAYDLDVLIKKFIGHYIALRAPPLGDRYINVQEVETVLCKYKSHWNGHYWIGKDCHEILEGLAGWGETADRLTAFVPEPKFEEWNTPA